jgi:hypothetical protein
MNSGELIRDCPKKPGMTSTPLFLSEFFTEPPDFTQAFAVQNVA